MKLEPHETLPKGVAFQALGKMQMFKKAIFYLFVTGVGLALSIGTASADEKKSYPYISGAIPIEVQNDANYSSDDPTAEFNNLTTKIEPVIGLHFTPELSVNTQLTLEQVQQPAFPGRDMVFDNQGIYFEVLTANYDTDRFSVYGGKFGPNFAIGWDATPGIYGVDLDLEYELAENIGFGGSVNFGSEAWGQHGFSASTFFTDTSGLAESAFTRRRKPRRGDGGPGNTGDLGSFAVALDGGDFKALPGFRYHIGFVRLGNETADADDETRFAIGAEHAWEINKDWGLVTLVEYVKFGDADGTPGQDRFYLTGSALVTFKNWNLAVAYTRKETSPAGAADINEEQFQATAGYAWEFGLGLDIGWLTVRNDGSDTDTFGTILTYNFEF